ncbi:MAG: CRISPR-associated endonuclease Cas2 [Candidatus Heimdallarchaeota archaeon]|nr:CRISPR-associated endonuclease Cas2 [Candidatus Heimdallarchaeota archaeon]
MIYLICYDITNDRLRTRVARLCENYAFERIQFSVFVGDTSRNMAETFALEAQELIKKRLAKVSIIPICQNCYEKVITLGSKPELKRKQMKLAETQQEKVVVL